MATANTNGPSSIASFRSPSHKRLPVRGITATAVIRRRCAERSILEWGRLSVCRSLAHANQIVFSRSRESRLDVSFDFSRKKDWKENETSWTKVELHKEQKSFDEMSPLSFVRRQSLKVTCYGSIEYHSFASLWNFAQASFNSTKISFANCSFGSSRSLKKKERERDMKERRWSFAHFVWMDMKYRFPVDFLHLIWGD